MITLTVTPDREQLGAFGRILPVSCRVRSLENKQRRMSEVVYSENSDGSRGQPYSPRVFPAGTWNVYAPHSVDLARDPRRYMWPYFIPTDACQLVDVWEVDQHDTLRYVEKADERVMDYGYGLHFSASQTTLGCLRIDSETDLRWLVAEIDTALRAGEKIQLYIA